MSIVKHALNGAAVLAVILFLVAPLHAQGGTDLPLDVLDPSGAGIPDASVVVLSGATLVAEIQADGSGQAIVQRPLDAAIQLIVSAPGFETVQREVAQGFTARTLSITLPIARVETAVVVAGVAEEAGSTSVALTEAEVDALPDDEESLLRMLQELAGPDAEVRVDGFGGGLPPKDQIMRITVRTDAYSAEFERPGRGRVDILTRPSADRWRTNGSLQFRPEALAANNALARDASSGSRRRIGGSVAGPLIRDRTSIYLSGNLTTSAETRAIAALTPAGPFLAAVEQPSEDLRVTARIESMVFGQSLMRLTWSGERSSRENQGLSELDLPERGYERRATEQSVRWSLDGGTRLPYYVRLRWDREHTESIPDTLEPAVVVTSAFRGGGASQDGQDRSDRAELETAATLFDGPITLRAGGQLAWVREAQGQVRNTRGTFTFLDLAAYDLRQPAVYTRRIGAEPLTLDTLQAALFAQADRAWESGWAVGAGIRYQAQTHLSDLAAWTPRLGISRSLNEGRTTVRLGYGGFYDWLPTDVREESLRLSRGSSEREIIVSNPGYPDPFSAGQQEQPEAEPPTLVTVAPGADLTRWSRISIGVTQRLAGGFRVSTDVYRQWTAGEWRAIDLNAPIGGVRPDPLRGRTLLVDSAGRETDVGYSADIRYSGGRRFASLRYRWARRLNDGDNALTPPPDGQTLSGEWGPARNDPGHSLYWSLGGPVAWGVQVSLFGRLTSGDRYSVTTGLDGNGDALFIERPAGVGRNDRRGDVQLTSDLRLSWRPSFGGDVASQRGPGGGGGRGGRGGRSGRSLEGYLSVSNLFNRVNRSSYVGVLTSRLFGQPTSAGSARRVEVGWRFAF